MKARLSDLPLRGVWRVAARELRSYLVVPWTYGVAVAFLVLTGVIFYVVAEGSREASLRFWFPNLAFVLLVTVPIVTSRLIADEWRTRHLDILLARPIGPGALVVGKWLAATGLFLLLLVPTFAYPAFLAAYGDPDWAPLVCSYVGAALLAALFCAVGTMASAVTPTAVAAGLGAFAILVSGQLATSVPAFRGFSFQPHLDGFARGAPGLENGLYFVSGTAAALIVAAGWQTFRRRIPGPLSRVRLRPLLVPAVALAAAVAVNLVPVPATARVDFTATGRFTLSGDSREVLRNVRTSARITAFAPEATAHARDARLLLENYRRVNPRIQIRVLDFAKHQGEALRLGVTDDLQIVVEVDRRKEIVAPLVEQLITSSLQRLARGAPQMVCALEGHGERPLDSTTPGGYQLARMIMEANGVETRGLNLTVAREIPEDCTILALIAPTTELLPHEEEAIDAWMADSGRMLIMREPNGPELDALTGRWGLRFLPGIVVDPGQADVGDPTSLFVRDFPAAHPVVEGVSSVQMVTAGGVTTVASDDPGLAVTRILQSTEASWLELHPTVAEFQPEEGDRPGPVVLGAAADRSEVEETGETRLEGGGPRIARTRLLLFADADWASNAVVDTLGNRRMLANSINWLAGEEDLVAIGGVRTDLRRLTLTPDRLRAMGWTSIGGVPGVVLLAGAAVWLRRRGR